MNTLLRRGKAPPVVLATILALGLLVGWVFVYSVIMMLGSIFVSRPTAYEQLVIRRSGQVYVQRNDGMNDMTYRTLEGQPIKPEELFVVAAESDVPEQNAADRVALGNGKRNPWESDTLEWKERTSAFRDRTSPPTFWYEMHDADPIGSVYFVGFDSLTRLPVGYVGRDGFRPDLPPVEDQFPGVPGGGYQRLYTASYGSEPYGRILASLVFINSGGKLFAFDASLRTIKEIELPGDVVAMGEYQTTANVSEAAGGAVASTSAQANVVNTAVRMADAVAILDGRGKTLRTVPIPRELREKAFTLYLCTGSQAIFQTGGQPLVGEQPELYWVNDQGEITRRAEVRLLGPTPASPRQIAWNAVVMIPVPAVMALGVLVLEPLSSVKRGTSSSFLSALDRALSDAWPPLLTVTLAGALLAALVYRRHRRISDRGAVLWTIFVFLSGLPGILAYWVHRSWPAAEQCSACSASVPRDRESCLACEAEFPLPAPAGCEIFS